MREIPKPFEIYRHFKGNIYQILAIATDSEDEKPVVVYQALYGEYKVYVRALDSFMSLVDKDKYPYVNQVYRFECVQSNTSQIINASSIETETKNVVEEQKTVEPQKQMTVEVQRVIEPQKVVVPERTVEPQVVVEPEKSIEPQKVIEPQKPITNTQELGLDPLIIEYLDAKTIEQRINILTGAHHRITDDLIDVMAACSDIEVEKGPVEERYQSLKNCLLTKQKFEKVRLF